MMKEDTREFIGSDELKREFEFETSRCQSYFDLMYKTFNFSFVAIVALVGFVCGLYGQEPEPANRDFFAGVIFCFAIPVCLYVFGIMYTFNAYALAACGKRAELLHNELYKNKDYINTKFYNKIIKRYIITDRKVALISYGVPLGFYILTPPASCLIGCFFV